MNQTAILESQESSKDSRWDRIGVIVSGLCLIHCLATPILISAASVIPSIMVMDAWVHPVLAALLLPSTWLAYRTSRRRQRGWNVAVLFSLGLVTIFGAWIFAPTETIEIIATIIGSLMLITGHWFNWRG